MQEEEYDYGIDDYLKREPIRIKVRHEPDRSRWTNQTTLFVIAGLILLIAVVATMAAQVWSNPSAFTISK